jgi:hypothetical protein
MRAIMGVQDFTAAQTGKAAPIGLRLKFGGPAAEYGASA